MGAGRPATEIARLRAACERLREELDRDDGELFVAEPRISSWSPAQHVEHVALVNRELVRTIKKLACGFDDPRGRGGTSALGKLMLALRWIPRGRGKAPGSVVPKEAPSRDELRRAILDNERELDELGALTATIDGVRGRAPHFVFGRLTARQWLAYANVHTRHHVKLLDDLARARASSSRSGSSPSGTSSRV